MHRKADIERVRQRGERIRAGCLELRVTASPLRARVGIVVPRFGHTAVDRNRLKRRLREIVRVKWMPHLESVDLLIRVAPRAYDRSLPELRGDLDRAMGVLMTRGVGA